jgi:hypothetical protein
MIKHIYAKNYKLKILIKSNNLSLKLHKDDST